MQRGNFPSYEKIEAYRLFEDLVGRFQVDFYSQTSSRVASFSATEDPVRRLGTTCLASEDKPAVHATEKTRQR